LDHLFDLPAPRTEIRSNEREGAACDTAQLLSGEIESNHLVLVPREEVSTRCDPIKPPAPRIAILMIGCS
jgi:hypothetical protein